MAVRTITTRLALDGEAEYKAKIKNINAELSLHKSQLEKVQAQYKNHANSTEALGAKFTALKAQLVDLHKKHTEQEHMLERAQAAYKKFSKDVSELEGRQKELQNSTEGSTQAEKQLQEELEAARKCLDQASNSVTFYQKQLNYTERDQASLKEQLKQTKGYLDEASASADGCATSIDQYGKEVKEAAEASEAFGDKAQDGIKQLAAVLAGVGIAKGVKEIASDLLECSEAARSFETSIAKISTIADPAAVSLDGMRSQILQVSSDANIASNSIGEAVYQAISSGVKTQEASATVEKAAKLAKGGFTSVETSVDVLTTAINAYKLKTSETQKISDILITTQKKGKTTVDELAQSVGKVIPLAAAYNVQMDNLGTSYAVLTANGIATAEAGTYLRSMLNELGDSGSKVAGVLRDKTGQSFAELTKSGRSIGDVLDVLGDSVDGSATAFNELWSSTEAGIGALSIFNSGAGHFNDVLQEMQDSAGATELAYRKMASDTDFAHQRVITASENLRITVGEHLNPALKELYNTGADAFTWAANFVESNPEVVGAVIAVTAGIGTMATGLTIAANAASIAAVKQAALNAVMAANPVGLMVVGLTSLVAAITAYSLTIERADAQAQSFVQTLKESKAAYEELSASMEEERSSVTASIRALEGLLEVEGKSSAEKEVILRKVEELNEKIPGLSLAYDEAADAINMTNDALERMAESAGAQEEQEARVERLNELYSEQQALEEELAETKERLAEAMADAQWDSFGGAMNDSAAAVGQLQEAEAALNAALEEHAAELSELKEAAIAYNEQQAESATQTEEAAAKLEALTNEALELEAAYRASYDASLESIRGQIGLFQEMDGSAKTSIDNLIETLKGQVDYMETYNENIKKAMEMGVDEGLVQKLSDGSEKSAQILAAIVQGGTEDIEELNEQLSKVEEGKENFANTIAEMETEFKKKMEALGQDMKAMVKELELKEASYKAGWNNIQGLIDGTASQKRALVEKYTEMGKAAIAAYKKAVDQHSPSRKFREAGSYDIRGIIEGAEAEKARLDAAYREMAQTALESMRRGMPSTFVEPRAVSQEDQTAAIAAAIKSLRSEIPAQSGQGLPFSQADLAAALREALSGLSVNMNQRKVGELVTDWQKNNDRSRGV